MSEVSEGRSLCSLRRQRTEIDVLLVHVLISFFQTLISKNVPKLKCLWHVGEICNVDAYMTIHNLQVHGRVEICEVNDMFAKVYDGTDICQPCSTCQAWNMRIQYARGAFLASASLT